jgi:glycerophosphoryl diester phosphodiesterase
MPARKRLTTVIGLLAAATTALSSDGAIAQPDATLEGRAVLPADTFAEGPSSGAVLDEDTKGGRMPPFEGQPVGGVSAVLDEGGGEYLAMADNGFGQKANSADFLLRAYYIRPDFETAEGGSGEIQTGQFVQLRDPDRHVPFEITNEESEDRLLTGADFDIESVRRDDQGNLWFGDEFGPFLLHTDAEGRFLEAPIPLPGVKSPDNPTLEDGEEPNLLTSKGFEGMAVSADGTILYPVLEGALEEDQDRSQRLVYEFDIEGKRYTGDVSQYRTETPDNSIGDLTPLGRGRFLVIERDNEQGEDASFKKVYEVDFGRTDSEGFLIKRQLLDLLAIRDPDLLSEPAREGDVGLGDPFAFPFQTIESILPLEGGRLLLLNDNNYPLSAGRNPDRPDDTEAIIVLSNILQDDPATQVPATRVPSTGGPPFLALLVGAALIATGALGTIAWLLFLRRNP